MHPNNAAGRLLDLFDRAKRAEGNQAAVEVWATVLGVPGAGTARDREVAHLLTLAGDQVVQLRAAAKRAGAQNSYLHRVDQTEGFLSVLVLGANWDTQVKPQLTDAVSAILETYAGMLPEDDERIPDEALHHAQTTVTTLRDEVGRADLPAAVKAFLLRQIALMERAIREYPLRGAPAFRDASDASAVDWAESAPTVAPYVDAPAVRNVKGLWERVDTWVTRGILYGHMAQLMWTGASPLLRVADAHHLLAPAVAEIVQPLLGPGGVSASPTRALPPTGTTEP